MNEKENVGRIFKNPQDGLGVRINMVQTKKKSAQESSNRSDKDKLKQLVRISCILI